MEDTGTTTLSKKAKKEQKNQRKKDNKRAKRLAAQQQSAQDSEPGDPSNTEHDASAESDKPENLEGPITAKLDSDVSSKSTEPERREGVVIAKRDDSPLSTETERLERSFFTKRNIPTIAIKPERLKDSSIAKSEPTFPATSTQPEELDGPVSAKSGSGILAVSAKPELHRRPIIAKSDTKYPAISAEQERLEGPVVAESDAAFPSISTQPERIRGPIIARSDSQAILSRLKSLVDPSIAKPDASDTSSVPERLGYYNIIQSAASPISVQPEPRLVDPAILLEPAALSSKSSELEQPSSNIALAKSEVLVPTKQSFHPTHISAFKHGLSTRNESEDVSTLDTDLSKSVGSDIHGISHTGLSAPTSSMIVSGDVSTNFKNLDLSQNMERPLETRIGSERLASPIIRQNTAEDLKSVQPDVPPELIGLDNGFENFQTELDDATTSRGTDSPFQDATSTKSNDSDSAADFYTPPEIASNAGSDHRGGLSGTSEHGDRSNSDEIGSSTKDKTGSDVITSVEALNKSESDSATLQTASAPEDVSSSSIATPALLPSLSSSTAPKDISETPPQNRRTVDNTAATSGQFEENANRSSKVLMSDSSTESSDDSTEDEYEGELPVVPSEPVIGVMGLKWAYATHTPADRVLLAEGIWLFEKPTSHLREQPLVEMQQGLGIEQAPVVMDTLGETSSTPEAEFDNKVLQINSHTTPWADNRADYAHPDFRFLPQLVEYQAAESMGLKVWRHDRDLLDCRLLSCRKKVADHNPESVVCLGCGPKTIIRYCSVAHMVADLKEHWRECGHGALVMKRLIDHTTAPARFERLCPAIRDSQNTKSYALCRQGLYSRLNHGSYTLFDWVTEEPTVLTWTKGDVRRGEMERRIERLLNVALFDQRDDVVVGYLFRLLRQCLQLKNGWVLGTSYALKKQFGEEFGHDVSKVEEDPVCECEWVGEALAAGLHRHACRRLYGKLGEAFHASGMNGYLEEIEARYWILRAWQQQHAAVSHWSDRVAGEGFDWQVEGASPVLGPGWTGWGGEEDDRTL